MIRVVVLLSTWNGMRFLPEQIETLLTQEIKGELSILIRDDGSTDGTLKYLDVLDDPRIRLVKGQNLGPRRSYFELLRIARETDGDYFALCDQDDFWLSGKLARAISLIQCVNPALYTSSLDLVDGDLTPIGHYRHRGDRSFVFTLLNNYSTGCTCVINRAFLDWMPFPGNVEKTLMHDWWLASVATIGAQVVYDDESWILYRQHASNHVGLNTGLAQILTKLRRVLTGGSGVSRFDHAMELERSAGEKMSIIQKKIVSAFIAGRYDRLRRAQFVRRHWENMTVISALRFILFG